MVEKQPSSCYHRNRSNGSLLFVWVPSPLPPSPVTTRPPHSSARHSRRTAKNLKQPYLWSVSHLFDKSDKWRLSPCRAEAAPVSGGERMMLINSQRIHSGGVFLCGGGGLRLFDFSNEMKLPHTSQVVPREHGEQFGSRWWDFVVAPIGSKHISVTSSVGWLC